MCVNIIGEKRLQDRCQLGHDSDSVLVGHRNVVAVHQLVESERCASKVLRHASLCFAVVEKTSVGSQDSRLDRMPGCLRIALNGQPQDKDRYAAAEATRKTISSTLGCASSPNFPPPRPVGRRRRGSSRRCGGVRRRGARVRPSASAPVPPARLWPDVAGRARRVHRTPARCRSHWRPHQMK